MYTLRLLIVLHCMCLRAVSRGKRNWKQYYAYLKGFLLYFGQVLPRVCHTQSHINVCTLYFPKREANFGGGGGRLTVCWAY